MSRRASPGLRRSPGPVFGVIRGPRGRRPTQVMERTARGPRRRSGRCRLRDPLVQSLAHRLIGRGLDFAAVRKRGGDRRYSDLAVTAVEVRFAGAGVGLAGIVVLGHFLLLGTLGSHDTALSVPGRLGGSKAWRFGEMAAEYGRNAQQIVSYRDISFLALNFNEFSAFLANSSSGLPLNVRVLVIADSARRRWSTALV